MAEVPPREGRPVLPDVAAAAREREASLQLLDDLLHTFTTSLDVRDVFTRVSEAAQSVLPHDLLALPLVSDDRQSVVIYAAYDTQGRTRWLPEAAPITEAYRALLEPGWDYIIYDDLTREPAEKDSPPAHAGIRSLLRVAVRLQREVLGVLDIGAFAPNFYTAADALIGRRLADQIALTLSHQRLAEEIQRAAALRERAAKLDLLDEALTAAGEGGALPEIIDRISLLTRKVLPHDALLVPVIMADRKRARRYASSGVDFGLLAEIVDVPAFVFTGHWEFNLLEDLTSEPMSSTADLIAMGFRSLVRVPIRVDGEIQAVIAFVSRQRAAFSADDVPVARRIADRMALILTRQRSIEAARRADDATERAAQLEARVRALTEELDARVGYRRVVGESATWRHVLVQATQVAATEATVLLLGESGTGKEVVARFIHRASARRGGPFIALNCAALPEQLLEAELFGYERGAFTGATQSKPGQLEQAAGGTLFLDEVGEMSRPAQAKFLRVLQEREFQRLGGTRVLRTDARIIAATNRDLQRAIGHGLFREDLFYRLNVFAIGLPPLRDRREDILPLSDAFLAEIARGLGRPPDGISRDAREALMRYHWPGNVRELRNILERAAILCDGGLITAGHLALTAAPAAAAPEPERPVAAAAMAAPPSAPASAGDLQSMERAMIEQALQQARFNKSKTARALGLTRQQLYVRMRRYGLE